MNCLGMQHITVKTLSVVCLVRLLISVTRAAALSVQAAMLARERGCTRGWLDIKMRLFPRSSLHIGMECCEM